MAPKGREGISVFIALQIFCAGGARVKMEEKVEADAYAYDSAVANLSHFTSVDFSESAGAIGDPVRGKIGEDKIEVLINAAKNAVVKVQMHNLRNAYFIGCKAVADTGTCGNAECARLTGGQFPMDKHCVAKTDKSLGSKFGKMVCCNKFAAFTEKGYHAYANKQDKYQRVGDFVSGKTGEEKIKVLINKPLGKYVTVNFPEVEDTNLKVECQSVKDTGTCGDQECGRLTAGHFPIDKHCVAKTEKSLGSKYGQMVCCRLNRGWEQIGDIVAGNRGETELKVGINAVKGAYRTVEFPEVKETKQKIECKAVADTGTCGNAVCQAQTSGYFPIDKYCNENSKFGKMVCCRLM